MILIRGAPTREPAFAGRSWVAKRLRSTRSRGSPMAASEKSNYIFELDAASQAFCERRRVSRGDLAELRGALHLTRCAGHSPLSTS
jgi:hypothetical protein